jgi:hypothetical protein
VTARDRRRVLERRYRRWLVVYPPDYRRDRGDELAATLLDLAGPNRTRPLPGDVLDLLRRGLAVRVRYGLRGLADAWSCRRRGRSAAAVAHLTALIMTISVFLAPATLGYSCVQPEEGFGAPMMLDCHPQFGLLLAHGDLLAYRWLIPPLFITGLVMVVRRRAAAMVSALSLTGFVVLTANSLGTYYLPSAVASWLAAAWFEPTGASQVAGACGAPVPPGRG